MKRILIYAPFIINSKAVSASGIRPLKIIEKLKNNGYDIGFFVGSGKERRKKYIDLQRSIPGNNDYLFVYGESSTMPSELTDSHHLPFRPFLDLRFLRFCKIQGIPTGLFYRDVYWRFPGYKKKVPWLRRSIATVFYRFDLFQYHRYLARIFVPSMEMVKFIPGAQKHKDKYCALPPGHDVMEVLPNYSNELKLVYVGGINEQYRMHAVFDALKNLNDVNLSFCTREDEWNTAKDSIGALFKYTNISIMHPRPEDLSDIYRTANIALLFVEPNIYRTFAVPYKMYEYIGFGIPIIASEGTLVGRLVEEMGIGWTIAYTSEAFTSLLRELRDRPDYVREKAEKVRKVRHEHTWEKRIETIEKELLGR